MNQRIKEVNVRLGLHFILIDSQQLTVVSMGKQPLEATVAFLQ